MSGLFAFRKKSALVAIVIPITITTAVTIIVPIAIAVAIIAVVVIAALIAIIAAPVAGLAARLVSFMALMPPTIGLTTVKAVVLDGFAEFVFRVCDSTLATIGSRTGRPSEQDKSTQYRCRQCSLAEHSGKKRSLSKREFPQMRMQVHTSLPGRFPNAG